MEELYEDPEERKQKAQERLNYGMELRKQMDEQRQRRARHKAAYKEELGDPTAGPIGGLARARRHNPAPGAPAAAAAAPSAMAALQRADLDAAASAMNAAMDASPSDRDCNARAGFANMERRLRQAHARESAWQPAVKAPGHEQWHQQSMEWLRVPLGYSEGPMEGLRRLKRELLVEYQSLGGEPGEVLGPATASPREGRGSGGGAARGRGGLRGDGPSAAMLADPAMGGFGRPEGRMAYEPDQLDRWIAGFQHRKRGPPMGMGGPRRAPPPRAAMGGPASFLGQPGAVPGGRGPAPVAEGSAAPGPGGPPTTMAALASLKADSQWLSQDKMPSW